MMFRSVFITIPYILLKYSSLINSVIYYSIYIITPSNTEKDNEISRSRKNTDDTKSIDESIIEPSEELDTTQEGPSGENTSSNVGNGNEFNRVKFLLDLRNGRENAKAGSIARINNMKAKSSFFGQMIVYSLNFLLSISLYIDDAIENILKKPFFQNLFPSQQWDTVSPNVQLNGDKTRVWKSPSKQIPQLEPPYKTTIPGYDTVIWILYIFGLDHIDRQSLSYRNPIDLPDDEDETVENLNVSYTIPKASEKRKHNSSGDETYHPWMTPMNDDDDEVTAARTHPIQRKNKPKQSVSSSQNTFINNNLSKALLELADLDKTLEDSDTGSYGEEQEISSSEASSIIEVENGLEQ